MRELLQFLLLHGHVVLFVSVLVEQLGAPVPAVPVLLAMGALAGAGQFSFATALAVTVVAAMISDVIWYELGRRSGNPVLRTLCRISLEPDSCVSETRYWFGRLGRFALVVAKFIPGLSMVAPPMAGVTKMPRATFLYTDLAGSALWGLVFLGAGYLFRAQLERAAGTALQMGGWLGILLVGGLAAWIGFKYWQRRRFINSIRVARVTPEEVMERIRAGEDLTIVDLRSFPEIERGGQKLPGAIWINCQELARRHHLIPRDRGVILYCT